MKALKIFTLVYILSMGSYLNAQIIIMGTLKGDNLLDVPQGRVLQSLNGMGYTKNINSAYNVGSINPASITNFNSIAAGVAYQFEQKIDNATYYDNGHRRYKNAVPQSAGIIIPVGELRLGAGFSQKYNSYKIMPPDYDIAFRRGLTFKNREEEYSIYSYYFTAGYKAAINEGSISLGTRLSMNYITGTDKKEDYWDNNINKNTVNWAAGVMYQSSDEQFKGWKLNASYESGIDEEVIVQHALYNYDPGIGDVYLERYNVSYKLLLDSKINIGADFALSDDLRLSAETSLLLPEKEGEDSTKFQNETTVSLVKQFNERITASIGFITVNYNKANDVREFYKEYIRGIYLTAGANIKLWSNISLDMAIADSHLLSGQWHKQAIGKIGLEYKL